jgi:hypothetical protein
MLLVPTGFPHMTFTRLPNPYYVISNMEVPNSNLYEGTGYPDIYRAIPQTLHGNAGVLSRLCHDRFLPNPLELTSRYSMAGGTEGIVLRNINHKGKELM